MEFKSVLRKVMENMTPDEKEEIFNSYSWHDKLLEECTEEECKVMLQHIVNDSESSEERVNIIHRELPLEKVTKEWADILIVHNVESSFSSCFDLDEMDIWVDYLDICSADNWCDTIYVKVPRKGQTAFFKMMMFAVQGTDDVKMVTRMGQEYVVLWWD